MKSLSAFFKRIREKHDLTYSDKGSFDEKWSVKVSTFNLIMLIALYSIIILFLAFLVIKNTGLKAMFGAGDIDVSMEQVSANAQAIDSLYEQTQSTQLYIDDLRKILNDEPFHDSLTSATIDSFPVNYKPDFSKAVEDSILRAQMENNPMYIGNEKPENTNYTFFFSPIKGIVSRSFDKKNGHYGVDVSAEKDEVIKSCLEGVVIFSGWDSEVGYVLIIQHANEILSVYKHCSRLFKNAGDHVLMGDPIAIVGNSGEHSSGPHLHFELWEKSQQINPEDFISFTR